MIELTFNDGGLVMNLDKAAGVTGVMLQKWLTRVLTHVHQALNRNMAGGLIGRRSGNLMRALRERVTFENGEVTGEIWPDPDKAIYGTIQEEGGTIIPKRAKHLAIPLPAMQTGNGVARGTARQVISDPAAFGFKGTFTHNNVIFGTRGDKRRRSGVRAIPLFALKDSVTIPGKHYLDITLKQEWTWIADELERMTKESVNVVFNYE